jgi:hypothetical protein
MDIYTAAFDTGAHMGWQFTLGFADKRYQKGTSDKKCNVA